MYILTNLIRDVRKCGETLSRVFNISSESKIIPRRKQRKKVAEILANQDQISKQRHGHSFLCLNLMNYQRVWEKIYQTWTAPFRTFLVLYGFPSTSNRSENWTLILSSTCPVSMSGTSTACFSTVTPRTPSRPFGFWIEISIIFKTGSKAVVLMALKMRSENWKFDGDCGHIKMQCRVFLTYRIRRLFHCS